MSLALKGFVENISAAVKKLYTLVVFFDLHTVLQ